MTEAETTVRGVEVQGRNPEISEYAVEGPSRELITKLRQVAEVALDKSYAIIPKPFRSDSEHVLVLVHAHQEAVGSKALEEHRCMPSGAHGQVQERVVPPRPNEAVK